MKTPTTSNVFISVAIVVCLSGCQSMYYAPNAQNVPMFKEKNEVRISAAYSRTGEISDAPIDGLEIQSAPNHRSMGVSLNLSL